MPGSVINAYTQHWIQSLQPSMVGIIPILQMGNLRLREVNLLSQCHIVNKAQNWVSNMGFSPEPPLNQYTLFYWISYKAHPYTWSSIIPVSHLYWRIIEYLAGKSLEVLTLTRYGNSHLEHDELLVKFIQWQRSHSCLKQTATLLDGHKCLKSSTLSLGQLYLLMDSLPWLLFF